MSTLFDNALHPQFDLEQAVAAGEAGQAAAEASAPSTWNELARAAVVRAAHAQHELTADDVWAPGPGQLERTRENRALGPALKWAAKEGVIVDAGRYERSRQVQCHGMPRRVWRSLVCTLPR